MKVSAGEYYVVSKAGTMRWEFRGPGIYGDSFELRSAGDARFICLMLKEAYAKGYENRAGEIREALGIDR